MADPISIIAASITGLANLFGKGRREADVIVPVQQEVEKRMKEISTELNIGLGGIGRIPAQVSTTQLANFERELKTIRDEWLRFLRDPQFTDGRASGQAANWTMPSIDGTCNYKRFAKETGGGTWDSPGSPTNPNVGLLHCTEHPGGFYPVFQDETKIGGILGKVLFEIRTRQGEHSEIQQPTQNGFLNQAGELVTGLVDTITSPFGSQPGEIQTAGIATGRQVLFILAASAVVGAIIFAVKKP